MNAWAAKAAEHLGQELQAVVIGKGVDNYVAPWQKLGWIRSL